MRKHVVSALACLSAAVLAGSLMAQKDPAAGATYLGVAKCKMCHPKQHKTWEAMKHAKAFEQLIGDEQKDPECLKCHTTGFGKGGYDPAKAAEENAKFANVQCESCHGPGSEHMKAPKEQKKATIHLRTSECSVCHDPHKSFGDEAKAKRAEKK